MSLPKAQDAINVIMIEVRDCMSHLIEISDRLLEVQQEIREAQKSIGKNFDNIEAIVKKDAARETEEEDATLQT